jgi:hypothetical protein
MSVSQERHWNDVDGWNILAVLAGCAVGAIVWFWPVGPLWRSGPGVGRIQGSGFSPDRRTLVTATVPLAPGVGKQQPPEVYRWDAATGKSVARVALPGVLPEAIRLIHTSPDGRFALVGEDRHFSLNNSNFTTGDWYLYDAVTGDRRAGPLPGIAQVSYLAFSPDNRWFWAYRGDPDQEFSGVHGGIDLFSTETGQRVLALPDEGDWRPQTCCFAPDSMTAAVVWIHKGATPDECTYQVCVNELPSGRERRRITLPSGSWVRAERWDGRLSKANVGVCKSIACRRK